MQEQNENISVLIDDELDSEQALAMLTAIQSDEALKAKLSRYQLIGQVLKNNDSLVLDSAFSDKIHQQIRQEPIYFMPQRKAVAHWRKAALAIAASMALAMVWVANKVDQQTQAFPSMAVALPQPEQPDAINARLNEYLQAHDNAVYVNNAPRAHHPYARVAGYQQE